MLLTNASNLNFQNAIQGLRMILRCLLYPLLSHSPKGPIPLVTLDFLLFPGYLKLYLIGPFVDASLIM